MSMQPNQITAPGRTEGAPAAPPSPATTTSTQPPPVDGGAQAAPPGMGLSTILMLAAPLLLVFFMSRSQANKQKQVEAKLKVGDRVVTRSGLIGKIIELGDRTAKLEIAPGVNVQMLKTAIEGVDGGSDAKDEKKDAAKDKAEEKKS